MLGRLAVVVGTTVYMELSAPLVADVPFRLVTVTSTTLAAAGAGGDTALIWSAEMTLKWGEASVPKSTPVACCR